MVRRWDSRRRHKKGAKLEDWALNEGDEFLEVSNIFIFSIIFIKHGGYGQWTDDEAE